MAAFLEGGGELGALMRAHDWARSPLGAPAAWPEVLRSTLGLCLDSAFPIAIYWGPQLALLYNDAWRPILGDKHPWALGRPGREVWPEIWEAIEPVFAQASATGKGVFNGDSLLAMNRFGYVEECYFDYTFNPIRGPGGVVAGIFNVVIETTYRVINARRSQAQREFAASLAAAKDGDEVLGRAAASLGHCSYDVPFALLYRMATDGRSANLAHAVALRADSAAAPRVVELETAQDLWQLGRAAASGAPVLIDDLPQRFGTLPSGPWPEAPREALVLAVAKSSALAPAAFLVAGVSPRRKLDLDYRAFFEALAAHMATAMSRAEAFENERRRAEALAELDRAKTAFFSNVSHEFRTPLTLMLGPVEDILAKPAGGVLPENRELLTVVHRNGQRLLRLVNTLLDFARIEAGRTQAAYEPVDLSAFTAELASNFRAACERAGLALSVDCPPLAHEAYVDREMWEKIVLNLLSNAFKFTLAGEIRVGLRESAAGFELEVSDTGSGIAAAELPRMFERFHRIEGARGRSHEGSGIGLALVHELVKLHGGSIGVKSTPGVGSTFTVSIPRGAAHLAAERIKRPHDAGASAARAEAFVDEALSWLPGAPASAARAAAGPRILLADDNGDLRDYAQRLLAEHYEVEAVADGEAALAAAHARRPDLIVSDVMMPRLDGFGLIRALRADEALRAVPVILLSARAGEEARIEGLGKGADDYLVKPFSARELLVRVGALLQAAGIRREAEEALRDRERTQRFLAEIGALGARTGVAGGMPLEELVRTIVERIAAELKASRCGLTRVELENNRATVEYEAHAGLASLKGSYALSQYASHSMEDAKSGRTTVVADAAADPRTAERYARVYEAIGIRAYVSVPLHREGRWVANLWVSSHEPRAWSEDEVRFLQAVADRVWLVIEQARVATALRESERKLQTLIANLPGMAYRCPTREPWPLTFASEGVLNLTGRPASAFLREEVNWAELIFPEDVAAVSAEVEAALAARRPFEMIYRIRHADGTLRWMLDRGRGIYDPQSAAAVAIEGFVLDLTRQQEAETALREADRRKDEFIATLSHELRNPLAPLRNALHLLRLSTQSERSTPVVQIMERQVNHLVRLVDDLLEISRISRGTLELRRGRVEVAAIVANAVETSEPLIQASRHKLTVSVPDEVLCVDGDAVRLAQILSNLLNNAAKYTDPGGRIELEARREQNFVAIAVRDNGAGIAPEALAGLFEMFSRGEHTSGREQGGLGIGLALARRLAQMHGGTLEGRSEGRGKGAEFTVRLPLAEGPAASSAARREAPAALPPRRVLVVDDNRDAAESLGMLLKFLGADVRLAYTGPEALDAYAAYQPAAVLLDIGMPGMDGYEVARRMKANGRRVPIVALTGWGQEDDRRRSREAGFDHHLIKPADLGALQSLLSSLQ